MTLRTPTGETPFVLAFGIEAVIPIELKLTESSSMMKTLIERN